MRPVVPSLQRLGGFSDAEMARKPAAMQLPDEEVASGPGGDTKTVAEEEESRVHPIIWIIICELGELTPVLAKIWALPIRERKAVEPNNGGL